MTFNKTLSKTVFFILIVTVLFAFSVIKEVQSTAQFLAILSFILLFVILVFNFYFNNNDYFSPLTLFSVMFSGYALGGFFYSESQGYFGKFIGFMNISDDQIVLFMQYGLFYALICYVFFALGYVLFKRKVLFHDLSSDSVFWRFFGKNYLFFVVPLLIIGTFYWYWVATVTAGGLFNLLVYFQAFKHLVAEAGVTTLPYHLYYAGIYLWLLGIVIAKKRVGYVFVLFSLLGMIINLSQGRITLAVTFIISQFLFIALIDERNKKRMLFYFLMLMFFAFFVYFLRIISNSVFIGADIDFFEKSFFDVIIGGGNVADLQQLVIIFYTFDISNSMLGITYFDWLRNTIGPFFGFSKSSIGLMIKSLYIPETSGAPTPGAIGEAYANFNIAAPFLMFFVGTLFAIIYKYVMKSGDPFILLIYSIFLARFVFIYPKVDSTMLVNFLWGAVPFSIFIVAIYFLFKVLKVRKNV